MKGALVVFAKAPRPGQVKTRMCPPLRPEEAAAFYECLLDDVLEASARLAGQLELAGLLAVHPPEACAAMAERAPAGFRVTPQQGANLAERMARAAEQAASAGFAPILLRGSDSPVLGERTLRAALAALVEADLAFCPDRDGGYNLVAMRRPWPGLFDHPMSTDSVLENTLANAAELGLRASVLEPGFDLDTVEDLRWLRAVRDAPEAALCPRTLAYARDHDLWRHVPTR